MTRKTQICDALAAFIRQRSGLEFGNCGDVAAEQQRSIARDEHDADTLLRAVRQCDNITAEHIVSAARRAFGGRLVIDELLPSIDFFGDWLEYRKAVAAVCAAALWEWRRAEWEWRRAEERYDSLSAGDWFRQQFRRDFGTDIQARWFERGIAP